LPAVASRNKYVSLWWDLILTPRAVSTPPAETFWNIWLIHSCGFWRGSYLVTDSTKMILQLAAELEVSDHGYSFGLFSTGSTCRLSVYHSTGPGSRYSVQATCCADSIVTITSSGVDSLYSLQRSYPGMSIWRPPWDQWNNFWLIFNLRTPGCQNYSVKPISLLVVTLNHKSFLQPYIQVVTWEWPAIISDLSSLKCSPPSRILCPFLHQLCLLVLLTMIKLELDKQGYGQWWWYQRRTSLIFPYVQIWLCSRQAHWQYCRFQRNLWEPTQLE
jgi:hypothetical protein